MILGIDVSTSKVGLAIIDFDGNLKTYDMIKFKKEHSLEQRAVSFENKILKFDKYYHINSVYIEQPAMMFRGGKTTAATMAKLQRFNGMCSYACRKVFDFDPELIHPNSARKKMNISIPRNVENKKVYIINEVQKHYPNFTYQKTRFGNPKPGTDDMADAIVVAYAGYILMTEGVDEARQDQDS